VGLAGVDVAGGAPPATFVVSLPEGPSFFMTMKTITNAAVSATRIPARINIFFCCSGVIIEHSLIPASVY